MAGKSMLKLLRRILENTLDACIAVGSVRVITLDLVQRLDKSPPCIFLHLDDMSGRLNRTPHPVYDSRRYISINPPAARVSRIAIKLG
ncbi:hypothetical protein IF1G_07474 [Cordyceps javanica]|uniref:Uncharacterized protein n=1 Tax=Cordyceps javanica TaxID=43265 RepID=A0A545UWA1_9HYPO|nr:hypothetical protein IF1G_07474 [Cordyceps javanica]